MSVPELIITSMGFPPYSVRGVKQTLQPIREATDVDRTVNGALRDLSDPLFQKFLSQVSCTDIDAPEFCFPGTTVVVQCVAELAANAYDWPYSAIRPPREDMEPREQGDWVFYRPTLTMKVVSFSLDHGEWTRDITWSVSLEEI